VRKEAKMPSLWTRAGLDECFGVTKAQRLIEDGELNGQLDADGQEYYHGADVMEALADEPPDDEIEDDDDFPEEDEYLSGEVRKPYGVDDDEDDFETLEKSNRSLSSLAEMGGLTVSGLKQLIELRKDRIYRAIQALSDGDSPVFTDQVAEYLGLEDESEIQPIMDDLAEDGLVEPVKEVSEEVRQEMLKLRKAWRTFEGQERAKTRQALRAEVRDLRVGFDRLLGRRR
jgi:hypothetical protein